MLSSKQIISKSGTIMVTGRNRACETKKLKQHDVWHNETLHKGLQVVRQLRSTSIARVHGDEVASVSVARLFLLQPCEASIERYCGNSPGHTPIVVFSATSRPSISTVFFPAWKADGFSNRPNRPNRRFGDSKPSWGEDVESVLDCLDLCSYHRQHLRQWHSDTFWILWHSCNSITAPQRWCDWTHQSNPKILCTQTWHGTARESGSLRHTQVVCTIHRIKWTHRNTTGTIVDAGLCHLKTISSDFNTFWCPPNRKVLSRTNHWRSRPWPWSLSHHRSSSPHRKWPRTWPSPLSWLHQSNHQNQRMWVKPVPLPSGSYKKMQWFSDSSTKNFLEKILGCLLWECLLSECHLLAAETLKLRCPSPSRSCQFLQDLLEHHPCRRSEPLSRSWPRDAARSRPREKSGKLLLGAVRRNDLSRAWWRVAHSSPCVLQWTLACVTASLEKICEETEETRQKCKNHGKTTSADGWTAWYS